MRALRLATKFEILQNTPLHDCPRFLIYRSVRIPSSRRLDLLIHFLVQLTEMVSVVPRATEAENSFIDLSGTDVPSSDNPYDALIAACCDNAVGPPTIIGSICLNIARNKFKQNTIRIEPNEMNSKRKSSRRPTFQGSR